MKEGWRRGAGSQERRSEHLEAGMYRTCPGEAIKLVVEEALGEEEPSRLNGAPYGGP